METLMFETSIKCTGCVDAITPELDKIESIQEWTVDLLPTPKTITIKGEDLNVAEIQAAFTSAGHQATVISEA